MNPMSVTSKGQVTIPQDIRHLLGIYRGSRVCFSVVGDHAEMRVVRPIADPPTSGFGMLRSNKKAVAADFDPATLLSPDPNGD